MHKVRSDLFCTLHGAICTFISYAVLSRIRITGTISLVVYIVIGSWIGVNLSFN